MCGSLAGSWFHISHSKPASVQDVAHAYNHFRAFFEDFTELDANTDFDSLEPPQIEGTIIDTPCHQHK